jgi:hypothetical protein
MGCRSAGAAATMALESQLLCAPSTSTDVGCCLPGCGMARGEKGRLIWGCNVPPPRPRPPYASFGKLRTTTTICDIRRKPKPGDCTRWKEGESGWSFLGVELHDEDEEESMFARSSSSRLSRKLQVPAISTSEAFRQRGELGLRRRIGWQGLAKERDGRWGRTMAAGCWAGNRVCSEGLSCIFVGPIETAEKARLEALYEQVMTPLKKMIFQPKYKGVLRGCFLEILFKQSSLQNSICSGRFQQKTKSTLFSDLHTHAVSMKEELSHVIIATWCRFCHGSCL